ncbi:MAG: VanW family protein [Luteolibacter sp.]|uniref:VanW family protein n=1 Tax=Luteolibacter sp. TaxID=1962973 RepID=UPI0032676D5E
MQNPHDAEHHEPSRGEAVSFFLKSRVLIARRWWRERGEAVAIHGRGKENREAPVAGEAKALIWTQTSSAEFPLTAGKVQNLRAACRQLDGVEIPAGEIFSFWKQLGRTTRSKGFTEGRELRSGCLVPNLGGGLCQLSGLLHAAAVSARLEVVERHTHSRTLPGVPLPPERDATVFWNYVDLRFRSPSKWRLETRLTATELVVSIRMAADSPVERIKSLDKALGSPVRAAADGDCLTCGVTSCFRHPSANHDHAPASSHGAWLLEGMWPEFNGWCRLHTHPGDHWMTPLDGHRWKRRNYSWAPPEGIKLTHATWETLRRSWQQRKLPGQGAIRQRFLLESQRKLAENFAQRLDPQARHLVISQTLLPHLWQAGHLGGRTFDVLVNRWPLASLQTRLDTAAARHPQSGTLADFRADPELVLAESQALAAAGRIVTPHRAIAASFGSRAILLDWEMPVGKKRGTRPDSVRWFFPASALGRKGIHELAEVLRETGGELLVLGRARENGADPLREISHRQATIGELTECTALVIPAWVEHEPRLALLALSLGIPVIASRSCGLAAHPLLTEVDEGSVTALLAAMNECVASGKSPAVTSARDQQSAAV